MIGYRANETNHCPGCGRVHWYIGRSTAECAFCATAIILAEASRGEAPTIRKFGKGGGKVSRIAA